MIKKILVVILVIVTSVSYAQEGTSSPYSFYGVGLQKFKGTVENRSMGGISVLTDSIHLNLQNPAAYGALKLTTYSFAVNYNKLTISNTVESSSTDNATLEYLAVGIPAGRFGFGFGVIPYSAVGYELSASREDGSATQFTGSGGLNKVFLTTGFKVNDKINIGLDINYNFGNIENTAILRRPETEYETREINSSDLSGLTMSLGITYKTMVTDKLELATSVVSTPSFKLSTKNSRELATIGGNPTLGEFKNIEIEDRDLELPAELKIGSGIGEPKKWFVGAEYTYLSAEKFTNRSFNADNVQYKNVSKYKLGGYYIPNYNSLTGYLSRVVYRAGVRYEETGLNINTESINEFGISFGVGLPVGNMFSNVNLGFEYGQRGTTNMGLIKEDFYNISISMSLNDRWFRELKFN